MRRFGYLRFFSEYSRLFAIALVELSVIGSLGLAPALAEERKDDSVQEGANSIENGFGELLEGMGQEIGKIIGSEGEPEKKKDKQESKPAGKEPK